MRYRIDVAHINFIVSTVSFFTCLFALLLAIVAGVVAGRSRCAASTMVLLGVFALYLFGQIVNVYLGVAGRSPWNWTYELQEIAQLLLIPSLALIEKCRTRNANRLRRPVDIGYMVITISATFLYVYGNFVNIGLWSFAYATNTLLLLVVVVYVMFLFVSRSRESGTRRGRIVVISAAILYVASLVFDRFYITQLRVMSSIQPMIVPLAILLLGASLIVERASAIVKSRTGESNLRDDLSAAVARSSLSDREREVISLLLEGRKYHEIGESLFISKATVKTHISRAYAKLGVSSKIELVNHLGKAPT